MRQLTFSTRPLGRSELLFYLGMVTSLPKFTDSDLPHTAGSGPRTVPHQPGLEMATSALFLLRPIGLLVGKSAPRDLDWG
jgi:hypothetical protein